MHSIVMLGHVSALQPASRWVRARALLVGDFSSLPVAQVEFTSFLQADGRDGIAHSRKPRT
jgi:hypothetical protein